MKTVIIILIGLISNHAFASGGHFHPKQVAKCSTSIGCTEDLVKSAVPASVDELINYNQMDKKWKTAKVDGLTKKEFKKGSKVLKAWVVTLLNEKDTNTASNKHFIFITDDGFVFKANATGELK